MLEALLDPNADPYRTADLYPNADPDPNADPELSQVARRHHLGRGKSLRSRRQVREPNSDPDQNPDQNPNPNISLLSSKHWCTSLSTSPKEQLTYPNWSLMGSTAWVPRHGFLVIYNRPSEKPVLNPNTRNPNPNPITYNFLTPTLP